MAERISSQQGPALPIRRYAWLVAVMGLLLIVASGAAYFINRNWALEAQIGAGLGVALVLAAVLLQPGMVRAALTGRPVKYGSNAVVMSLAFIGILGVINFISLKNNQEYDLTENKEFTLSEQTIQILKNMDQPVQIVGFFQAGDARLAIAKNFLERYSQHTDQLTYEFHDPNVEPALARSFELSNYGLVFVSGDHRREATSVDEQTITSGLVRVTGHRERGLYFLTGHGGYSVDSSAPEGYSMVKQGLERENYLVKELNLAVATQIPPDADLLVLAGPTRELSEGEVQLISGWMDEGGRLLLMVDPLQPVSLNGMLQAYGLFLRDGFVVDTAESLVALTPDGLYQQVTSPMVTHYPYHEITRGLKGYQTFFPFVRAVDITQNAIPDKSVSALVSTSPGSWIETDMESTDLEYNEGADIPGPIEIGAAVEDGASGARLVVFGNGSFVSNQHISPDVANQDLFLNAVNWLTEDEELISIRPKQSSSRQVFLTPMQHNITLFTTLILMPLTVFATGVAVWWKRR